MRFLFILFVCLNFIHFNAFAEQTDTSAVEKTISQSSHPDKSLVVGSHVSTNMNSMSILLSLLMVLAVIIISALILKRFNLIQSNHSELKIVTSLPLSTKEKLVVVQVGKKQLLLGVTAQQINLLESLNEPLELSKSAFSQDSLKVDNPLFNFLKKTNN